jgi:hypothetical protein
MHVTLNRSAMFGEQHGEHLVQIGALDDLQWSLQ